jgi:O-antigen biosynthesis protein
MEASVRVGVVIPTKDPALEPAATCLKHLAATTKHLDVEVATIVSSGPDFRFSRSINEGLRRTASADAWVLLNDDAFMDEGWLDAMLETRRAHPNVGVVGAVLRFPTGKIQHAGGHIPLKPAEFLLAAAQRRAPLWGLRTIRAQRYRPYPYMMAHWHSVKRSHRLDFITGACYLLTKECLEKVGTYDENYEFGSEDVDHSLRVLEAGLELAVATRATGVHLEGASSRKLSDRTLRSLATFRATWSADRIARATRGRSGVHHP